MPELPEVETVVRDLRPLLVGRTIERLEVGPKALRQRWDRRHTSHVAGRTVHAIDRRGKWIVVDLDGPRLLVHLGMTGQLTVAPGDAPRQDHTHFVFELMGGGELRFRDIRRFGSISYFPDQSAFEKALAARRLGPEPFDLDPVEWTRSLRRTRRNLKACLLDQRLVAGVGNIYADEALHDAGINPRRLGRRVSREQAERLRQAIVKVLTRAIEFRGSTIRNYVGGSGLAGRMQNEFQVYGRTGQPCLRCGQPIERITLAGRSTHFCKTCQR